MQYIAKVHRYRYVKSGRPVRTRTMTQFVGYAPNEQVGCFSSSSSNMRLAILGRVLSKEVNGVRKPLLKTLPLPGHEDPLRQFADAIRRLSSPTTALEPAAFAAQYSGGKRKEYDRAAESLRFQPLIEQDSNIKLFLKLEKDIRSQKPGRIPRCILPPDVRYTVETGRFVHPMEKTLYATIDELWGSRVVTKGRNYSQVGDMFSEAWLDFNEPCSLDCDVSKMDQSITEEVLEVLLDLLADLTMTDNEYLRKILKWTLRTKVRGRADDGMFSYHQRGTLSSGMCYTSITGVFVVTGIAWLFRRKLGIKMRMVDAGDDMTLIFEKDDLPLVMSQLAQFYAQFGLTLEIGIPNFVLEGIEFCQSHPVKIGSRYQMVRNARTAGVKDYVCVDRLDRVQDICAWWESVGKCGLASQGGSPVATARYNQMVRSSSRLLESLNLKPRAVKRYRAAVRRHDEASGGFNQFGKGMTNGSIVSDESRFSYYLAFGMTPQVQRALEEEFDTNDLLPFKVDRFTYQGAWDVC